MIETQTFIVWMDPANPLPSMEEKWIRGGELDGSELACLERNRRENPDVRVRERCRTVLSAVLAERTGDTATHAAADPHARRLLVLRHKRLLVDKIIAQNPKTR